MAENHRHLAGLVVPRGQLIAGTKLCAARSIHYLSGVNRKQLPQCDRRNDGHRTSLRDLGWTRETGSGGETIVACSTVTLPVSLLAADGNPLSFVASDGYDTLRVSCLAEIPCGRFLFVNSGGSENVGSRPRVPGECGGRAGAAGIRESAETGTSPGISDLTSGERVKPSGMPGDVGFRIEKKVVPTECGFWWR